MITRFDRSNTHSSSELTRDLEAAFAAVAKKHNIEIHLGSGSFSAAQLAIKLVMRTKNTDVANNAMAPLLRRYGLPANAIGRSFSYKGELFEIKGINPKKRRYPVETRKVSDGSIMNFGPSIPARLLGTDLQQGG